MVDPKVTNLLSGKSQEELREKLQTQPNTLFIDPEQYCALAVSCRKLSRADHSAAGLKGLFSEDDGIVYYVEEEILLNYLEQPDHQLQLT